MLMKSSTDLDLQYFAEWGGRVSVSLLQTAIEALSRDDDLRGADLLEVGTRHGKMAVLFALLGANVTGIDGGKGN